MNTAIHRASSPDLSCSEASSQLPEVSSSHIEQEFLKRVLTPYREHCIYLQNATFIESSVDKNFTGKSLKGEFSIAESCYIDDTGHFNAVEFNICYNQLCYVLVGHCIRHGLAPELFGYNEASFFEKQLSNFLIANISSNYRAPINPRRFYGTIGIESSSVKKNCTFIKTWCHYHDDDNGNSKGEVLLAVLNP